MERETFIYPKILKCFFTHLYPTNEVSMYNIVFIENDERTK